MTIRLGAFELTSPLARGAMGEVWAARHPADALPVAIKVITADYARHPQFQASLRREVRAMATLAHPGIVHVLDQGEVDDAAASASDDRLVPGSPFIAMERVDGGTLADHVLRLPWADVRDILLKLLAALAHAHAAGVVHRDLKPANILLARGGTTWDLRLTDFGIAQPLFAGKPVGPKLAGTLLFMAPEQARGAWRAFQPATDLYAVGRVASALLARRDGVAAVPPGFNAWMQTILSPDVLDRFPCAADAAHQLLLLDGPTAALDPRFDPPSPHTLTVDSLAAEGAPRPRSRPRPATYLGRHRPPLPHTWRAPRRLAAASAPRNAGAGLLEVRAPPLIGREAERDRLWSALRQVVEGGGVQVVELRGVEGIGKRFLARWFARRAQEVGAAWGHTVSFAPVEDGVDAAARLIATRLVTHGLAPEAVRAHLGQLADAIDGASPADVEALAEVLSPVDARGGGRGVRSDAERINVIARFLRWEAASRPTVVVLEHAQWSIVAAELVRAVAAQRGHPSVLFVMTVDPDALATCPREREALGQLSQIVPVTRLLLPPLRPAEQRELVASQLGLDPALVSELVERTEGNPLRAVQIVRELHRRGRLVPGPHGWRLASGRVAQTTIDGLWTQRLATFLADRPATDQVAAELLAVPGAEVHHDVWQRLCRRAGVPASATLIDALIAGDLLRNVDGERYAFAHPSLRAVVLLAAEQGGRLAAHHASCADHLHRYETGPDRDGRIGEHLLRAGRYDVAREHLRRGAEAAIRDRRLSRARDLLRAWEQAAAGLREDDPSSLDGLRLHAELALMANELRTVSTLARDLVRRARARGWIEHELVGRYVYAVALSNAGQPTRARSLLEQLLDRTPADRWPLLRAKLTLMLARMTRAWGETELAARLAAEARALYLRLRDRHGELACLLVAASVAHQHRRPDEALSLARTAKRLGEELRALPAQAEALIVAAEVHRAEQRLDAAIRALTLARRILHSVTGPDAALVCELNLASALAAAGQDDQALPLFRACIERLNALGRATVEAMAHCLILPTLARLDHQPAFERHLLSAAERLDERPFAERDVRDALQRAAELARGRGWTAAATRADDLLARLPAG